jgi:hypothetical protein
MDVLGMFSLNKATRPLTVFFFFVPFVESCFRHSLEQPIHPVGAEGKFFARAGWKNFLKKDFGKGGAKKLLGIRQRKESGMSWKHMRT